MPEYCCGHMHAKTFDRRPWIAAPAGILAFWLYAPPAILVPSNLGWLLSGDSATHLFGLLYFLRDSWALPPGQVLSYGEGFASSVLYSDSIPILALLLKAVASVVGGPWLGQPFGAWLLLCFVLQAYFSFRIAALFIPGTIGPFLVSLLACLAPPFLMRGCEHQSLMAHWLIIWALLLLFGRRSCENRRSVQWPLLLVLSLGIHPSIFTMCFALWAVANFTALRTPNAVRGRIVGSMLGTSMLLFVFAYGYGYFMGTTNAEGWGYYKLNLLAVINPMGWSRFLPSFSDTTGGEYEGFAYFGLGILGLLGTAGLVSTRVPRSSPFEPARRSLFLVAVAFTGIALTPNVNAGALGRVASLLLATLAAALVCTEYREGTLRIRSSTGLERLRNPAVYLIAVLSLGAIVAIPLYLLPHQFLAALRSSGRLFWSAWYIVFFGATAVLAAALKPRYVALILAACSMVQLADLSQYLVWQRSQCFLSDAADGRHIFVSSDVSQALEAALSRKARLQVLAVGSHPQGWEALTLLALQAGASINKAYFARYIPGAYETAAAVTFDSVDRALFREDTVYLAYPEYRARLHRGVAQSETTTVADVGAFTIAYTPSTLTVQNHDDDGGSPQQ